MIHGISPLRVVSIRKTIAHKDGRLDYTLETTVLVENPVTTEDGTVDWKKTSVEIGELLAKSERKLELQKTSYETELERLRYKLETAEQSERLAVTTLEDVNTFTQTWWFRFLLPKWMRT